MASYHHKGISRIEAEELLLAAGKDGSFLVRDSETVQGAHTLCLLSDGVSKQYRILPGKNGLYVQAEEGVVNKSFADMRQLIESYVQRGEHNGLLCALKYPVPVESADSDDDDEDYPPLPPHITPPSADNRSSPSADNRSSTLAFLKTFKERSQQLDLSSVPGPFANAVKLYAEDEILIDRDRIMNGAEKTEKLQDIVAMACEDLDRELNTFMTKIEVCKELFGSAASQPLKRLGTVKKRSASEESINQFYKKLSSCKSAIESLEKKAVSTLRARLPAEPPSGESCTDTTDGARAASPPPVPPCPTRLGARPQIPKKEYDIHLYKYGKAGSKLKVTVDVEQGKLFAVKEKGSQLDETNVFSADQIQQLIKSSKDKCRLEVKIVDRKHRDNYLFSDARQRESFCQHVKQMKMMHSQYTEVSLIKVFVGTWNMGESPAPVNLNSWLKCQGLGKSMELQEIPHDVYVIGTQETASSDWVKQIKIQLSNNYGVDFHLVASETLWQIRIIVLVKPEYKDKISHVQTANVATGIANKLGNKGGVATSFTFNGTGFCFICSHLAARHDEKRNLKRHQNYRDIVKSLNIGPRYLNQVCDITNRFHHVFFFGDLNYRLIDLEPELILSQVKQKKFDKLLDYDQLTAAQKKKHALSDFKEDEILFPPTYRYQKGSKEQYAWEKIKKSGIRINAPSWCDRVLWKSYPDTHLESHAYGCVQDIITSDHKPVFSSFEVGLESQALPPTENSGTSTDTVIVFEELEAKVRSHGKEAYKLEFHSGCLEKVVLSQKNSSSGDHTTGFNSPKWKKQDLPQLRPLFGTMEYLEGQHLIVAVKTDDGMESYGEGVVSLKLKLSSSPVQFDCPLTHQGESTGRLWGKMHIRCQSYNRQPRAARAYELVYVEEDGATEPSGADRVESYSEPAHDTKDNNKKQVKSDVPDMNYSEPSGSAAPRKVKSDPTAVPGVMLYTEVNISSKRHSRMLRDSGDSGSKPNTKGDVPPVIPPSQLPPKASALPPKSGAVPPNVSSPPFKPAPLPPKSGAAPPKPGALPPPCAAPRNGKVSAPEEHAEEEFKPTVPPRKSKDEAIPVVQRSPPRPPSEEDVMETLGNILPKPAERIKKKKNADDTNNNTGAVHGHGKVKKENEPPARAVRTAHKRGGADKGQWPESAIFPLEDNPLYKENVGGAGVDVVDYGHLQDYGEPDSKDFAPTLPPRKNYREAKDEQVYYDRLNTPTTVEEWLKGLKLTEYSKTFKESGWDRIDYLEDMNKEDLRLMGIRDPSMQQRILLSIADMNND